MTSPMTPMPRRPQTVQNKEAAEGCAAILLGFALLIPLSIYEGWVMMVMWGWFVAPIFNLPTLGLWSASGLALLIDWLQATYRPADAPFSKKDPLGTFRRHASFVILMGMTTLVVGRFLHAFMG